MPYPVLSGGMVSCLRFCHVPNFHGGKRLMVSQSEPAEPFSRLRFRPVIMESNGFSWLNTVALKIVRGFLLQGRNLKT